ncbi:HPr family phosphocarrier protein [Cupriavidus campinensis]|uniref:HPr family phosphocarrier protein n=1 Tax=Cupriavidus campinensis TaxID=151783 RepID=UPI0021CCF7ED|nr:HPr family phosphocarrier protein [Cupriavidus campinensis]
MAPDESEVHEFDEGAVVEVTLEATVRDGFQERGSAGLAFAANKFEWVIRLTSGPWIATAKKVMEVMRLCARVGAHICIRADGVIAALLKGEKLPKSL